MRLEPLFRCQRCNGRVKKQSPTSEKYQPSKLEILSASLNRLACTFVFDANTNINCIFPVFREARRLREVMEDVWMMVISLYAVLLVTLCFILVLGFDISYTSKWQTIYLMVVSIPISTMSCLARPTDNAIMKQHVTSPKYIQVLNSTVLMIKGTFLTVISATFFMIGIHFLQM